MTVSLPDGVAVAVEDITKVHTSVHEQRYRPTMSYFTRLRDRQLGLNIAPSDQEGAGGDDDDDDDDTPDDDSSGSVVISRGPGLARLSVTLAPGEPIALLGRDGTARELTRIASGMMSPTSGRIVAAGRIGPSCEMMTYLLRREGHPRRAARALAALTGVPVRHRSRYVRDMLDFVIDDEILDTRVPARGAHPLVRRISIAATLDPRADVLVVDMWPQRDAFLDRCVERLQDNLERGAAAFVVNPPDNVRAICPRAMWLENGKVLELGPSGPIGVEFAAAVEADRRREASTVAGFDDHVAIHGVETRPSYVLNVDDDVDVAVRFELAHAVSSLAVSIGMRGVGQLTEFRQPPAEVPRPGRYTATASIPGGTLVAGDYAVDVELRAEHVEGLSHVAWAQAARLRVTGDEVDRDADLEFDAAEIGAPPGTEPQPVDWEIDPV